MKKYRLNNKTKEISLRSEASLVLKKEVTEYIKAIAMQQGESHAILSIWEYYKIFLKDNKVNIIKLPSYYTKYIIYQNYC